MSAPLPGPAGTDPAVLPAGCVAKEIGSALTSIPMAVDRSERATGGRPVEGRPPSSRSARMELNQEGERVLAPLRRRLEERGIELRMRPFPGEMEVCGDPHHLREALP